MNWLRQASFPKITAILARLVAKIQNKESEKVRLNFSKKIIFLKIFEIVKSTRRLVPDGKKVKPMRI